MKKLWYIIRNIFLGIFVVLALMISPFVIAASQPFQYLSYRRSHFFRDTGAKYKLWSTDSDTYRLYELIHRHNLPIRYLQPKDPELAFHGWFLAGTTLLLHDLEAMFYEETLGGWTVYPEDEEPLSETISQTIQRLREDHPGAIITDIRILMEFSESSPEDRKRAEQDPLFLIYDTYDRLPELLRTL